MKAFVKPSRANPIPEFERLSVAAIIDKVDQLIKPFKTSVPINIVDSITSIDPTVHPNGTISGANWDGKIFLFRDSLGSMSEVADTLFHELLHFGFRRYLTGDQYPNQTNKLYSVDKRILNEAEVLLESPQAEVPSPSCMSRKYF